MVQNRPLVQRITSYVRLGQDELQSASDQYRRRRKIKAGIGLVHQRETEPSTYIVAEGLAFSERILTDGAQQIVNFQNPRDFLGVRWVLFRTSDYNVEPITPMEAL